MQYRKSSVPDTRLREENERKECTFRPRINENPFVSEKTLRKYGEATPASAMLRKNRRGHSPTERNGPGLLAGTYTAAGGLKRGPPEKPGLPMFYFDPFSPPNFATGTYGAPQTVTQIITAPLPAPAPAPPPAASPVKAAVFKAPPLPPWLGKPAGKTGAGTASNKLVIVKKEKVEAAAEPTGWQAIMLEMQRKANKRNGGGDAAAGAEKEKKNEPPKPQPKPKRTLGKKKEFKDPVEELKYKFALKRGEIQEEDGGDDDGGDDNAEDDKADAKSAGKKAGIAAMLAKRNAPPAAAPAATASTASTATASAAPTGNKAVTSSKKIPSPPPLPTGAWPPVPSKEVIKANNSNNNDTNTTAAPKKAMGGALAGAAAALATALANRNNASSSNANSSNTDTNAADTNKGVSSPGKTATANTANSTAEPIVTTLKPGESIPEGATARTMTIPGTKVLPDGYYLAANSNILVAPYEILPAGETTVSLILQITAQMDPDQQKQTSQKQSGKFYCYKFLVSFW